MFLCIEQPVHLSLISYSTIIYSVRNQFFREGINPHEDVTKPLGHKTIPKASKNFLVEVPTDQVFGQMNSSVFGWGTSTAGRRKCDEQVETFFVRFSDPKSLRHSSWFQKRIQYPSCISIQILRLDSQPLLVSVGDFTTNVTDSSTKSKRRFHLVSYP